MYDIVICLSYFKFIDFNSKVVQELLHFFCLFEDLCLLFFAAIFVGFESLHWTVLHVEEMVGSFLC